MMWFTWVIKIHPQADEQVDETKEQTEGDIFPDQGESF